MNPLHREWRRTLTTIFFCLAFIPLTFLIAVCIALVQMDAPLVYKLAVGLEILLGIVLIGLSFTVAMRQIKGSFLGGSFDATGGGGDDPITDGDTVTVTKTAQPSSVETTP
jgi:hypothetical protein